MSNWTLICQKSWDVRKTCAIDRQRRATNIVRAHIKKMSWKTHVSKYRVRVNKSPKWDLLLSVWNIFSNSRNFNVFCHSIILYPPPYHLNRSVLWVILLPMMASPLLLLPETMKTATQNKRQSLIPINKT